ncbi:hypothetical protein AHF37_01502 [Paragonimus kellicotti]|nr:hypothetical protein AHF37_01502 [Paragonimus kellicotti]
MFVYSIFRFPCGLSNLNPQTNPIYLPSGFPQQVDIVFSRSGVFNSKHPTELDSAALVRTSKINMRV